jgi:hypothetical protein
MKRGSAGSAGLAVIGWLSLGARRSRFPLVGRGIERTGGRPVLAAGAILLASGLLALAETRSFPGYLPRLDRHRARHGGRSLQSGVFHARAHLRAIGALADYSRDAIWRVCQHRLLAPHSFSQVRSAYPLYGGIQNYE